VGTARPAGRGGAAAARPWEPAQATRLAWARPGRARPRGRWRSAGGPAWCAAVRAGEAAETPGPPPVPPAPSSGWPRGACAGGQQARRRWTTASQTGDTRAGQPHARRRWPAGARRSGPRRVARCPARGPHGPRGRPKQTGNSGGHVRGQPPGAPAQHTGRQRPTASMARPSCARASPGRDGSPGPACRRMLEGPAPHRGDRATAAHAGCPSHPGRAEAVTGVLGGAPCAAGPLSHPRRARGGLGPPREAAVGAGNVPDAHGRSEDCKRQKRSHHTEPVPVA
jgi:hypothetical protein